MQYQLFFDQEGQHQQYVPFPYSLALSLFMLFNFTDHAQHATTTNDLALITDRLHTCSNFHSEPSRMTRAPLRRHPSPCPPYSLTLRGKRFSHAPDRMERSPT